MALNRSNTYKLYRNLFILYDVFQHLKELNLVLNQVPTEFYVPEPFVSFLSKVFSDNQHLPRLIEDLRTAPTNKHLEEIRKLVREYMDMLTQQISLIPNDLMKAKIALIALIDSEDFDDYEHPQIYDALVLMKKEISKSKVSRIARKWSGLYQEDQKRQQQYGGDVKTNLFWSGRTGQELMDAMSRYRFMKTFNVKGFESVSKEIEEVFEQNLTNLASNAGQYLGQYLSWELGDLLWLITRSETMTSGIREAISVALKFLSKSKIPKEMTITFQYSSFGSETMSIWEGNNPIRVDVMALSAIALLTLSNDPDLIRLGREASEWIGEFQNSNGSWSRYGKSESDQNLSEKSQPDIDTTILAIEAILRSNSSNASYHAELGMKWLLSHQNKFGLWQQSTELISRDVSRFKLVAPSDLDLTVRILELEELFIRVKNNNWSFSSQSQQKNLIFMSYSRRDWEEYVEQMYKKLVDHGFNIWIDQTSIEGGDIWLDKINEALDQAEYMLLFVTPASLQSKWVKMEYRRFIERNKFILPVICKPSRLPAELSPIQSLELDQFSKIEKRLKTQIKNNSK